MTQPPTPEPDLPGGAPRGPDSEFSTRWRRSAPDPHLTWGQTVSGDAFVRRAARMGAFGEGKRILEIGPGYGRIVRSVLKFGLPFGRYVGLDISPRNVQFLTHEFSDPRIGFVEGNVETARLEGKFDTIVSSLTFKHLFPTFEVALRNLRQYVRDDGVVIFDLMERFTTWPATMFRWQVATVARDPMAHEGATYVRSYARPEVDNILVRSGYRLAGLSHVAHTLIRVRLLVVARPTPLGKPGGQVVPGPLLTPAS